MSWQRLFISFSPGHPQTVADRQF